MIFSCSICCTELASSKEEVFTTPCHHVFHETCLKKWLDNSESCPQCRQKFNRKSAHRLYLTTLNNDTFAEIPTELQEKIDNLDYQLRIKEQEVKKVKSEKKQFKNMVSKLEENVKSLQDDIETKNSAIFAYSEQSKHLKKTLEDSNKYKDEAKQLRDKLCEYRDVQKLLTSSIEDANEVVTNTTNFQQMSTYVIALKKQLDIAISQRKNYKTTMQQLTRDLKKTTEERNNLAAELKNQTPSDDDMFEPEPSGWDKQFNKVKPSKIFKSDEDSVICMDNQKDRKKSNNASGTIMISDEENSPTFRFPGEKRKLPRSSSSISANSILIKKSRPAHSSFVRTASAKDERLVPDGLGGYKKIDTFPVSSGVKSKVGYSKRFKKP